jgi:ArsR family transcriptional regulator
MNQEITKALCNPIRLKIISCIAKKGKTVSELINNCHLSQSAVSQHLAKLKNAGLVKDYRNGREIFYSVTDKKISAVSDLIINLCERK